MSYINLGYEESEFEIYEILYFMKSFVFMRQRFFYSIGSWMLTKGGYVKDNWVCGKV